jgi:urease accessory protein
VTVMVAVGLWTALKGGRAIWAWPCAFVAVMLVGGALGMAHVPIPFVEPGILASVVTLGLLVALVVDLPVWLGGIIIGMFALFHGHAHGTEVPETAGVSNTWPASLSQLPDCTWSASVLRWVWRD